MPKDAYYFPHDCNARNDPKVLRMRSKYGAEGLGWYWMIIEILREQEGYMIPITNGCIEGYSIHLQASSDTLEQFINDCVGYGLFEIENEQLFSPSLLRRMEHFDNISEKARRSALKRWEKEKKHDENDATAMQGQCDRNASKVKYSKVNNIYKGSDLKKYPANFINLRKQVFEGIKKLKGYKSRSPSAEAKAISEMLEEGFSPEQIIDAYKIIKERPFFKDKDLTLMSVRKDIHEVLKKKTPRQVKSPKDYKDLDD